MSPLEITQPLPFDPADFEALKELAQKNLANQEKKPNAQAVALLSAKGRRYGFLSKMPWLLKRG